MKALEWIVFSTGTYNWYGSIDMGFCGIMVDNNDTGYCSRRYCVKRCRQVAAKLGIELPKEPE